MWSVAPDATSPNRSRLAEEVSDWYRRESPPPLLTRDAELSVEEQRGGGDCRPACLRIIYGYRDVVRIRVNGASILQHKERLFFGLKEPNFGALLIDGLANRPQPGMSLARRSFSALRSVTKGMVKAERP